MKRESKKEQAGPTHPHTHTPSPSARVMMMSALLMVAENLHCINWLAYHDHHERKIVEAG